MDSKNAALGERIRQARKTLGLTQQEFAAQLAVTQPTVHRWEKGFYDPDEAALQRLAGMTKLSPAYFRYGEHNGLSDKATAIVIGIVDGQANEQGEVQPLEQRDAQFVAAPATGSATMAVAVRGKKLEPIYGDGDVLFYDGSRRCGEADFLDRDCVVKLRDGATLLRRVASGSQASRYTLSLPGQPTLKDVALDWAAPIGWIRRR